MREFVGRAYQQFREPGNFLRIVLLFITGSLTAHFVIHYDPDWGATNLILSVEATIASAALMVLARDSQRRAEAADQVQAKMLETLLALAQAEQRALERGEQLLGELLEHERQTITILERLAAQRFEPASAAAAQEA